MCWQSSHTFFPEGCELRISGRSSGSSKLSSVFPAYASDIMLEAFIWTYSYGYSS